ncbi:uncharacterized protein LOC111691489 [Anoplophora glabripennis]|uniref:uncharacterized protein LOC111691489 n=1 Tax=Anoplophora glabripennis TaxID=217634 RepID=UPI000C774363|nr:uncharacterized protein LOC111691489 [Anoplophora glabripennis]
MTPIFGRLISKISSGVKQDSAKTCRYLALFRKTKKKENLSPYIILRATKDDHLKILKLMHECYFVDEPKCYSLGVNHNAILDEQTMSSMSQGMTLVARCKYDGSMVGGCINMSAHSWDADMTEKFACSVRCPKVRQLLLFHAQSQRLPDVWKKYDVNKVFEMSMLFVHKLHRKRGLGYRLVAESIDLGADCGYKVVRCDASNAFA